jgi:hypothetical protein
VSYENENNPNKTFFDSSIELTAPTAVPTKDKYKWSQEGGMEALCVSYPGNSLYAESPSKVPILEIQASEIENGPIMLARKTNEFVHKIPTELMKLFISNVKETHTSLASANNDSHQPSSSSPDHEQFSHLGLLEKAKAKALDRYLKQL